MQSQLLADGGGATIIWVDLEPWGDETGRSSNPQPHTFTTYERDADGGDEAMMRRYESKISRFSQPDPYDGSYDLSDPQSFNRYSYTQNDPVNFTDPSGLEKNENCYITEDGNKVCIDTVVIVDTWAWNWPALDNEYYRNFVNNSRFGGYYGGGGTPQDTSVTESDVVRELTSPQVPCPQVPETPPGVDIDRKIRGAEELKTGFVTAPFARWAAFGGMFHPRGPNNFKLQGEKYQDIGNFLFGAAGLAAGFSPEQLVRLAGYFQEDKSVSSGEKTTFGGALSGAGGKRPYGDQWRDYNNVLYGMVYYVRKYINKDCP